MKDYTKKEDRMGVEKVDTSYALDTVFLVVAVLLFAIVLKYVGAI